LNKASQVVLLAKNDLQNLYIKKAISMPAGCSIALFSLKNTD
jgi:hypothetical protein